MTTFEISTTIDKPVGVVVEALMNPDNHPCWTADLVRFEVVKGKAGEAGSVGRLHYVQNGQGYIMEDRMLYSEPGRKYISQVEGDALTARVETTLNAIGDKTEMSLKWSGKGKVLFLKIFLPLLRGKIVRQGREDLETFKRLVEERGVDFSCSLLEKDSG